MLSLRMAIENESYLLASTGFALAEKCDDPHSRSGALLVVLSITNKDRLFLSIRSLGSNPQSKT